MQQRNLKVLIVGGGGREHALAWKTICSPHVAEVFCAPGNAGIEDDATCVKISAEDVDGLVQWSSANNIDLVIVGPEAPLVAGLVDKCAEADIRCFGPSAGAAQLEGSKRFAKQVMEAAGVPTAGWKVFTDADEARAHARELAGPQVVKADGLAAGKGVYVCDDVDSALAAIDEIMVEGRFGEAGAEIIIEELLVGPELSFIALADGKSVLPLATSRDHKRVGDGDSGPNTGGMGAFSPVPEIDKAAFDEITRTVLQPVVDRMAEQGTPYAGVLYAGLIMTAAGPKVLEFNCRFGDPECQPLMLRMKSDLIDLIDAALHGKLDETEALWWPSAACCVVAASGGYPGSYEKGKVIGGLDELGEGGELMVFHAGTRKEGEDVVTNGGRVLSVTALGDDIEAARARAYAAMEKISFEGMHYRRDIAVSKGE